MEFQIFVDGIDQTGPGSGDHQQHHCHKGGKSQQPAQGKALMILFGHGIAIKDHRQRAETQEHVIDIVAQVE